jgi:hypothetical protein
MIPRRTGRRLFLHPAHATVGVGSAALRPYGLVGGFEDDGRAEDAPLDVAIVAAGDTPNVLETAARVDEILSQRPRRDVRSRRVNLVDANVDEPTSGESVFILISSQVLCVAAHWSDVAWALPVDNSGVCTETLPFVADNGNDRHRTMTVEIAAGAWRHPIVEGVAPFAAHGDPGRSFSMPGDAALLLTTRTAAGGNQPVAWLEPGLRGPIFCASLNAPADIRQPAVVRLLINALTWIAR